MQTIWTRIAFAAITLFSVAPTVEGAVPFPKTNQETCALLAPQVASMVLKGSAAPDPVQLSTTICLWKVPLLRLKSPFLTYEISRGKAGCGHCTRSVAGVGDAAFWVEQTRTLYASKNNVFVSVQMKAWDGTPIGDADGLSAVAREILRHF